MDQVQDVVGIVAVMLLVILASYYVTMYVSVKAGGSGKRARCFKMIDRYSVSRDKMFVLVAMGKQAYFIGITNQGMTVIDKTSLSELPLEDEHVRKQHVRKQHGITDIASLLKNCRLKNKMDGNRRAREASFSDYLKDAENEKDQKDE